MLKADLILLQIWLYQVRIFIRNDLDDKNLNKQWIVPWCFGEGPKNIWTFICPKVKWVFNRLLDIKSADLYSLGVEYWWGDY